MLLVCEGAPKQGIYFPEQEFNLTNDAGKIIYCRVMAMYVGTETVDLSFITEAKYRRRGYALKAARMMISWGLRNKIKKMTITNLADSIAIDKIAAGAGFSREKEKKWVKLLTGPINDMEVD